MENELDPLKLEDDSEETADQIGISEGAIDSDGTVHASESIVPVNRPRKVYGGMWGRNELIVAGIGVLAIVSLLVYVFVFVVPAQQELAKNKIVEDELDQKLTAAKSKYGSITDTETQVARLITSVNDFETRFMLYEVAGKTALYERLNSLISAYGLLNVNGPEYSPLEILDLQRRQQAQNERGRDKLKSLFPGMYVTVTVEGPYQNLRRFIRDIETSQQFIMVSSVEFVPADKQKQRNSGEQDQQVNENIRNPQDNAQKLESIYRGKMHGDTVSLKIEMAAYFRRPDYTPFEADPSSN